MQKESLHTRKYPRDNNPRLRVKGLSTPGYAFASDYRNEFQQCLWPLAQVIQLEPEFFLESSRLLVLGMGL